MMITSEIVYRTLISREDADSLDYSPSMIPLTKVIEYLLNDIYGKIKGNIVLKARNEYRFQFGKVFQRQERT